MTKENAIAILASRKSEVLTYLEDITMNETVRTNIFQCAAAYDMAISALNGQPVNFSEEAKAIGLRKRIKYAGDVHAALLDAGWDLDTATLFVNKLPDAKVVEIDQFNPWISVEDRLPKDMGDVLVWAFWHEKWGVRLGWHSQYNDGWHICTASGDFGHIEVTHWMPLPHITPLQSVITKLHETKSDCADRK